MTTIKTLFVITVSTVRFLLPGVPAAHNLPEAAKQPGTKSLSIEVSSSIQAGPDAKATVSLPAGLKIAGPVSMQFDNNALKALATDGKRTKLVEYWGNGREVTGDQPRITLPDAKQVDDLLDVPNQSYAYWPTPITKALDDTAPLDGAYEIKTNFCGNASITLGKDQAYLDPIDITSSDDEPDLTKPIVIRWKPVANVSGYVLKAYGGSEGQTVVWTSSTDPDSARNIENRALTKEEVDRYIKTGVLIPSYVASCTIPAGVFKGADSVMLVMTAVGKDLIQTNGDTQTRVVVRSTASAPLHSSPYESRIKPKNAKEDTKAKTQQK